MRFIELRPGVNIAKEHIISVEKTDDLTCSIGTAIGIYQSVWPSWRILMQLEAEDIKEQTVAEQTPVDRVNLWGKQHFAG